MAWPSLRQDPPQQPEVLLAGEGLDACALRQPCSSRTGLWRLRKEARVALGSPARVEELSAAVQARNVPAWLKASFLARLKHSEGLALP